MIKSIEFINFRNLCGKYNFDNVVNVIIGKNNSGKSNLLDGIKLAFSVLTNDYFKISKSDFYNSDDSQNISIKVELKNEAIPSLNDLDENLQSKCGFIVSVRRTQSGRYVKELSLLNGGNVDFDILREDEHIPNIFVIPLLRIDEIYTNGLVTGISKFIESEEQYQELKKDSKERIKEVVKDKVEKFQLLCKKFNQNFDIDLTEPKITDEKVFIVEDGQKEHNYKIGAGYRSIANIMLNTLNDKNNIILIDEIENHLHPALIRTLIRELKQVKNTQIVTTTHSSVVINEFNIEEIIDINHKNISLSQANLQKINTFLHAGRNELLLADKIILVEGYTEELLLRNYLNSINYNWTVINVAGVMFEPYIELAKYLNKKVIVISDNDKSTTDELKPSSRFSNLKEYCNALNVPILEMDNTLETDLYNYGYLEKCKDLLVAHEKHPNIYIAKNNYKTAIALRLIKGKVDLTSWHIIKEIINEFEGN